MNPSVSRSCGYVKKRSTCKISNFFDLSKKGFLKKIKKTIAISKNCAIIEKVRYEIRPYQPGS